MRDPDKQNANRGAERHAADNCEDGIEIDCADSRADSNTDRGKRAQRRRAALGREIETPVQGNDQQDHADHWLVEQGW